MIGSISGRQGRQPIQSFALIRPASGNSFPAIGSQRSSWTGVGGASRLADFCSRRQLHAAARRREHVADVDVEHGMSHLGPSLNLIMHMVGTMTASGKS